MNKQEFERALAWLSKHVDGMHATARLEMLKAQAHTLRPEDYAGQVIGVVTLQCVDDMPRTVPCPECGPFGGHGTVPWGLCSAYTDPCRTCDGSGRTTEAKAEAFKKLRP